MIGASLSGIDVLCRLLETLPAEFPAALFITQHVASHSPGMLPYILTKACRLPAVHPKSGELIQAGRIYVAPPDRHMLMRKGYVRLSHGPHENNARPAIDALFCSAAVAYGPAVVGVVLTGQLDDGTAGLLAIKDRGGTAVVQDPSEATAQSMPMSAIQHVAIDYCCKLVEMAPLFIKLANDDPAMQARPDLENLMEIENRIADGVFSVDDWWGLEQMSAPSGLSVRIAAAHCTSSMTSESYASVADPVRLFGPKSVERTGRRKRNPLVIELRRADRRDYPGKTHAQGPKVC